MILALGAILAGGLLLTVAADQFVIGAARVALLRRMSPVAVGVLIIGFGTSAPELLVSALAAAGGNPEVAVGNIVGSNLANLTLILGAGALVVPLRVDSSVVRREIPLTLGGILAFALAVQRGGVSVGEAAVLLVAMVGALILVTRRSDGDPLGPEAEELVDVSGHRFPAEAARTLVGLAGTLAGAQALLWGAVDLADRVGLSGGFVGATLVAVGTSLPELVTVIQSARRRETDLVVGNLLGSCLFNALTVGAAVGLLSTVELRSEHLTVGAVGLSTAAAVVAATMMITGHTVTRREGVVLVVGYVVAVPFLA